MRIKIWQIIFLGLAFVLAGCSPKEKSYTNSIGMKFVLVPDGSFMMGGANKIDAKKLGGPAFLTQGDYDEKPVHKVTISDSYYMSVTEVTVDQFKQFRPGYKGPATRICAKPACRRARRHTGTGKAAASMVTRPAIIFPPSRT